jgi:hypothetical protein
MAKCGASCVAPAGGGVCGGAEDAYAAVGVFDDGDRHTGAPTAFWSRRSRTPAVIESGHSRCGADDQRVPAPHRLDIETERVRALRDRGSAAKLREVPRGEQFIQY